MIPNDPYELGPDAEAVFALLELDLGAVINQPSRRPLLRFCLDWSEQRHHLGGRLGAALLTRLRERDWVRRGTSPRNLIVTERGHQGLTETLGIGSDRESRTGLAASEAM